MKIILTADLHIGRRSSRLPSSVDSRSISSAAAWSAVVDHAISQKADVVALGGDVIDQANGFYEAYGPLERGLLQLREAGIDVVAVCGNHDHAVLAQIARALPDGLLTLLGVGGRWERHTIERNGKRLHVDGWSFNSSHVHESPLASHTLPDATDAPVLGLLHADLDQPGSSYAPVRLAELRAKRVALWLLGHVHCSVLHDAPGGAPVLYPGSPNPLDPGEPGVHGAWEVELSLGGAVEPRLVPLARVRYETIEVDVAGLKELGELRTVLTERVRETADALCTSPLQHLSLRVRLTGGTPLHRALDHEARLITDNLVLEVGGARVQVERVEVHTRPERDLQSLAVKSDAAAYLARLLQSLEAGDVPPEYAALLQEVDTIPDTLRSATPYAPLPSAPHDPSAASARDELARQAELLLDELLAQNEVAR